MIPNKITRKTFESADSGRDIIVCKDAADMFKKLGIKSPESPPLKGDSGGCKKMSLREA